MRRSSLAGSVIVHLAVVGAAFISWPRGDSNLIVGAVPVTIVSDVIQEAAPRSEPEAEAEALDEQTFGEPEPAPPEPTPPVPTPPAPTPPAPTPPQPAPQPAQQRPPEKAPPRQNTPPTQTPPRQNPAQNPPQRQPDPGLDLDALSRPGQTRTPNTTGPSGQGSAPVATGPQIAVLVGQIYEHWNLGSTCEAPNLSDMVFRVRITISSQGRVTSGPTLVETRSDPAWRTAAEAALRAVRAADPFRVPDGFVGQTITFRFLAEQACGR
ncbi:MAG: hypothetical protein ACK4E3_09640 [Brevundimonas sp.]|uniref:hypothetical protein n=1 Tax=Brevundimonas sp. TaxID=1871086 RepID=UPI003918772B